MRNYGDFALGSVVRGSFNTRTAAGVPITLGGSPAVSVFKDGSVTQSIVGASLTVDFDAITGHHLFAIDTSADGAFYSSGSDFRVVITTGTVDAVSVVGSDVGSFSINNRSALRPTVPGRALDVSTGGEAGIDLANVGNPTAPLALTNTTISPTQVAASVTGNVGGNVTGSVGSVVSFGTLVTSIWANATRTLTAASDSSGITMLLSRILGTLAAGTHSPQTGDGFARLGAPNGGSISADIQTRLPTAGYTAPPTASAIADQVWDEVISGHATAGSTGAALAAAGGSGDPWATVLPGAYAAGTAGYLVGNDLGGLDAAGIRLAIGLDGANLDAKLAAMLADTGELQTDFTNGGRLDLLLDAIKAAAENSLQVGGQYKLTNVGTAGTDTITIEVP